MRFKDDVEVPIEDVFHGPIVQGVRAPRSTIPEHGPQISPCILDPIYQVVGAGLGNESSPFPCVARRGKSGEKRVARQRGAIPYPVLALAGRVIRPDEQARPDCCS